MNGEDSAEFPSIPEKEAHSNDKPFTDQESLKKRFEEGDSKVVEIHLLADDRIVKHYELEEQHEPPPPFEGDPLEEPEAFLEYLKLKNPEYDYSHLSENKEEFTPDEIKKAIEAARKHNIDISEISPEHITIAESVLNSTEPNHNEVRRNRIVALRKNKEQLMPILAPTNAEYAHATAHIENARNILEVGLYCDSRLGLDGTAASLSRVNLDDDQHTKDQKIESNLLNLADFHRGHRYVVLLNLPDLTPEQEADYRAKKANGKHPSYTSYFVEKLPEKKDVGAAYKGNDAVLPSKYIKGFLDLDTGQFVTRQAESNSSKDASKEKPQTRDRSHPPLRRD